MDGVGGGVGFGVGETEWDAIGIYCGLFVLAAVTFFVTRRSIFSFPAATTPAPPPTATTTPRVRAPGRYKGGKAIPHLTVEETEDVVVHGAVPHHGPHDGGEAFVEGDDVGRVLRNLLARWSKGAGGKKTRGSCFQSSEPPREIKSIRT